MGQVVVVLLAFVICLLILTGWHFERPPGADDSPRPRDEFRRR
jgi:hypothetical protein